MPKRRASAFTGSSNKRYKKTSGPSMAYRKSYRKRAYGKRGLYKIAKQIMLKNTETKYITQTAENFQLYQNGYDVLGTSNRWIVIGNLLNIPQGTTQITRIGDEVHVTNVQIKLWISNKSDRPNVMFRVFVLSVPQQELGQTAPTGMFKGLIPNRMLDYIDSDKYTIKYHKMIKPLGGDYSLESGATNREHSNFLNIKFALNRPVKFNSDAGIIPKLQKDCLVLGVVAYDAYGTLQADNIASLAYVSRVYFKDP